MSSTKAIPDGFHTVTPHLIVKGAAKALDFYREAFGAEELFRNVVEGTDVVMHARMRIGDSFLLVNDEFPEHGVTGPSAAAPSPVTIHIYVDDVDAIYQRAVDAGVKVLMPLGDQFWGDRYAMLQDPFGHRWSVASQKEELTPEQIRDRAKEAFS